MSANATSYRPDIDGLRAISIIAVVAFHAFPGLLRGGFVGVDVFFVISGYLITSILLRSLQQGKFRLSDFYARRIRRIFPALVVVLVATYLVGWLALWPDEYMQFSRYLAAGTGFIANLVLWSDAGYFDTDSALKPLLHLWSLSVEEQFYIAWPLLLWAFWRRNLLLVALAVLLGSFLFNVSLVHEDATAAFYSPLSRAWEPMIGAIVAYLQMARGAGELPHYATRVANVLVRRFPGGAPALRHAASVLGFLFILTAIAVLNKSRAFPGWWALLPTFGAMFLIAAGPLGVMNRRVLSTRGMVWIGLISYPLYLWHWPILSFARVIQVDPPAASVQALLVMASVVAACATYWLVERPLRLGNVSQRGAVVGLSGAMISMATLGLVTMQAGGLPDRANVANRPKFETPADWANDGRNTDTSCQKAHGFIGDGYCLVADSTRPATIVLIGDSHANQFYWGLADHFRHQAENLLMLGAAGCVPFMGVSSHERGQRDTCQSRIDAALNYALSRPEVKLVALASRGPLYISGHGFGPAEAGRDDRVLTLLRRPDIVSQEEVFSVAMTDTVQRLTKAGKQVLLIADVPELGFNPVSCLKQRPLQFGRPVRSPCAVQTSEYLQRNRFYLDTIQSVASAAPSVRAYYPSRQLCRNGYCDAIRDGEVLYRDDNHLSFEGSMYVGREFARDPASAKVN